MSVPRGCRLPGVGLVLEVDDVVAERDRVTAAGWPLAEDLQDRPWGLKDFRILDLALVLLADYGPGPLIASACSDQPDQSSSRQKGASVQVNGCGPQVS